MNVIKIHDVKVTYNKEEESKRKTHKENLLTVMILGIVCGPEC